MCVRCARSVFRYIKEVGRSWFMNDDSHSATVFTSFSFILFSIFTHCFLYWNRLKFEFDPTSGWLFLSCLNSEIMSYFSFQTKVWEFFVLTTVRCNSIDWINKITKETEWKMKTSSADDDGTRWNVDFEWMNFAVSFRILTNLTIYTYRVA